MNVLIYQLKCCFGPFACSSLCIGPVRQSITTRVMYSLMLVIVSVICAFIHERKFLEFVLAKFIPNLNDTCITLRANVSCQRFLGYKSIYRLSYSFTSFHLIMMLFCIQIGSSQDWRSKIHNGFWFFKVVFVFGLWIAFYMLPKIENYMTVFTIAGVIAALIFIVIQDVSLIDCAYELNGYLREKGSRNSCCNILLYIVTIFLYILTVAGYIFLYWNFAAPKVCLKNRVIILVNASASFLLIIFSLFAGKHNKNKLYIPGAVTCLFVVFLTWTAISSDPNERIPSNFKAASIYESGRIMDLTKSVRVFQCTVDHKIYKTEFGKDMDTYLGILIMLGSAVYCSIKSTINYKRYGIKPARSKMMSTSQMQIEQSEIELNEMKIKSKNRISGSHLMMMKGDMDYPLYKVNSMPSISLRSSSRTSSRISRKTSKDSSNLVSSSAKKKNFIPPQTILDEEENLCSGNPDANDITKCPMDSFLLYDEYFAVRYSYSWFHFIFALAYLFVMVQLTNWYSPQTSHIENFGKSWPSMWMKITTSWIALALYSWTLMCPAFCVGRRLYEYPLDSMKRYRQNIKSAKPITSA